MNTDPKRTVRLLNQLEKLGFDDRACAALHHMGDSNWGQTIQRHRRYCERKTKFRDDGKNARVQRRLEYVLAAYEATGLSSGSSDLFYKLAKDSVARIPMPV